MQTAEVVEFPMVRNSKYLGAVSYTHLTLPTKLAV